MKNKLHPFSLAKETFSDWMEDKALRLSAALAYYAIFSIAPLLVIVTGVAGWIFGPDAVRGHLDEQLNGYVGAQTADTIQSMVKSASHRSDSIWTTAVGVGVLLFGAGGVFGQLKDALNTIWEVQPRPGRGIWGIIQDRFLSFTMVLGTGFLLLISLAVSTGLAAMTKYLEGSLPLTAFLWIALNFVISLGVVTLLFAMMFRYLPDVRIKWKHVWIGAFATALLFNLGKYLLGLYLGRESVASAYGAAGTVVILLLWVYYASLIMLLGAEFTQVYARAMGSKIVPDKNAVAVNTDKRKQEGLDQHEDKPAPRRKH